MAKIREEDLESLRERASIVDVVSSHTTLKKSGGHTFKGLCPFHSEKTPSFSVDTAKGLYFCFGCGEGGDIFKFVEKQENLPFNDAAEWLARRFGVELTYEDARPGDAQTRGLKQRLVEANAAAAEFFHHALINSPAANDARLYLEGRGFDRALAERWKLGWAPGRDALVKHLLARKFSRDEILKADLGRVSERDGSFYDTFRQRITFPTWNLQGDVVAFGARALGDQQPKYLNSSETPVFSKSRVMYGLDRAKSSVGRGAAAVVVEGYTDVIALHEAGVKEAVATNGVALGETHFEQLKKFTERVVLMFDADEAGRGAAERGWGPDEKQVPVFARLGLEVLVAPLPAGRDPADLAREEGAEGIQKVLDAAQPLIEFKLEQTIAKLPLDTPEARARAVRDAAQVLGWHPDPISIREYEFMVARRIGVDVDAVQRALAERRRGSSDGGTGSARVQDRRVPGHVKVEKEALRLLLVDGDRTARWAREVNDSEFTSPVRRELFAHALAAVGSGNPTSARANILSSEALTLMTELTVGGNEAAADEDQIREVFMRLKVFKLEREIKARRNTLQEINPLVDAQQHDALFTELVGLEAERRDLLRSLQGAA